MKGPMSAAAAAILLAASAAAAAAAAPSAAVPAHQAMRAHHRAQNADARRMTQALNLLEANGYGAFSGFRQDGKNFVATVMQNGKPVTLTIDPDAGKVTRQS